MKHIVEEVKGKDLKEGDEYWGRSEQWYIVEKQHIELEAKHYSERTYLVRRPSTPVTECYTKEQIDKLIDTIQVVPSNFEFISKHGKINGTLYMELHRLFRSLPSPITLPAIEKKIEINFDGHVLALFLIKEGNLTILNAMNGYGHRIGDFKIKITEIK